MNRKILQSPIGNIIISEENENIVELNIDNEKKINIKESQTPLLIETAKQLEEYFLGKRKQFDIPLKPKGTEFMQKVWNELKNIPYGETRTYKDIAISIGNEKASRAVGMANNKNPIPIIIPCHRVIGSNKSLVGYALGLGVKEYLLNLEKQN